MIPTGRARLFLLGAVAIIAVVGLRPALWRPFDLAGSDNEYVQVAGAIHVHTALSDGGGAPEEVIRAARSAGLGFVAITDHNNLDAKRFEGYHDGVLILVGAEISTDAGHLVALGIPDPAFRFSGSARDGLDDVRALGGVAFAAHPWSPRTDLQWSGWDLPGPWGVELLNMDSEWRRSAWPGLIWAAALYGINHQYALLSSLSAPGGAMAKWDALLAQRDVPGIVGADAHSRISVGKDWRLRFPSYESLFALAQNHVILGSPLQGDAASDAARILDALRRGSSYAAIDALAPANGFSFTAESGERRFTMGDTAPVDPSLRLRAGGRLPASTRLMLLRDGHLLAEREASIDLPVPGPGVYRVEAHLPGWTVPWLLSNPIYVYDDDTRTARAARAAWGREMEAPAPALLLDTFQGRTIFRAGADASSWVRPDVLDPTGGPDGHGSGRIEFRLGAPGRSASDASCEIINREPRDLSGRTGLVFSIKGSAVFRLWVQVRDANAGLREGTETWSASVRTSEEWRRVAIPFAAFRSDSGKSDGRLDLGKVRALAFVLDRGAVKTGTSGTIWIDDFGVY